MLLNGIAMPEGYSIYSHQVAGHRFETGKQGMLIDSDGKLLKPIQAPPRGEREVEFYQTVFGYETSNPTILKLRQFVPTFYGVKHVVFPDLPFKADNYIILENLTRHFNKPCILDVKIGKCITDHLATKAKQERAVKKYPEQEQFGFRILGMKVYNNSCQHFEFYDKGFGKNLTTHEEVLAGLNKFFCQDEHGTRHIEEILEHLKGIKSWALEQRMFKVYSSSILIIYEGNKTANVNCLVENRTEHNSEECNDKVSKVVTSLDSLAKQNAFQASNSTSKATETEVKLYTKTEKLQKECSDYVNPTKSLVKCGKKQTHCLENSGQLQRPTVSTHLVDFAHTYIGHYSMPDDNYLYGLNNLIHYFELVR